VQLSHYILTVLSNCFLFYTRKELFPASKQDSEQSSPTTSGSAQRRMKKNSPEPERRRKRVKAIESNTEGKGGKTSAQSNSNEQLDFLLETVTKERDTCQAALEALDLELEQKDSSTTKEEDDQTEDMSIFEVLGYYEEFQAFYLAVSTVPSLSDALKDKEGGPFTVVGKSSSLIIFCLCSKYFILSRLLLLIIHHLILLVTLYAHYDYAVPVNLAFEELDDGDGGFYKALLEDAKASKYILNSHVVGDIIMSADLITGPVETLSGYEVPAFVSPIGAIYVDKGNVIAPDIKAANGVIHAINEVIIPTSPPPDDEMTTVDESSTGPDSQSTIPHCRDSLTYAYCCEYADCDGEGCTYWQMINCCGLYCAKKRPISTWNPFDSGYRYWCGPYCNICRCS
jgi:hypothetical protein